MKIETFLAGYLSCVVLNNPNNRKIIRDITLKGASYAIDAINNKKEDINNTPSIESESEK